MIHRPSRPRDSRFVREKSVAQSQGMPHPQAK
jgi:hypothetical protein